jgi:hypothetical protein
MPAPLLLPPMLPAKQRTRRRRCQLMSAFGDISVDDSYASAMLTAP